MKINKGQFSLSSRLESLKFNLLRGRGHLVRYILNRLRWHYYPKLRYVPKFPDHVDLEISSACDLNCPMCYTITDAFKKTVSRKLMDFDLFRKCVDECAHYGTYSIRLSLRGEPFLHPEIIPMMRYVKERGIPEVSSLTHGLRLNPEIFEEMVKIGFDWLTISFDGIGETYERIRKPARFEEGVEKIREYDRIKKRMGAEKPVIKVQSIWPAIKDDPEAFFSLFRPIVQQVSSNPLIDYLHSDTEIEYIEDFCCPNPWQRLVVGSDGRVLMCSYDEFGRNIVGDANTQSLYEIWNGEGLAEVRRIHRQKSGVELLEPCRDCPQPRKTKASYSEVDGRALVVEDYVGRTQEIGK